MDYPYNPIRLLLNALAVCQVFGEAKKFSETRLITTYIDKHIRIECATNDDMEKLYLRVWQFYAGGQVRDVLIGYVPTDTTNLPELIFLMQLDERRDSPLMRWEERINTLFLLHQTGAVPPFFAWDLAVMDDNPGWSQITRESL